MKELATYEFYTDTYGGNSITAEEFPKALNRATYYINTITRGRISEATQAVSMAVCAAMDAMKQLSLSGGKVVTSESVGSWSRSYAVDSQEGTSIYSSVYQSVKPYLLDTDLLYGGLDDDV